MDFIIEPIINPSLVLVWDLDETLAHTTDDKQSYRMDLIDLIFKTKSLGATNILWTRGSLLHMMNVILATPLEYCFDLHLWDTHCNASKMMCNNYKHVDYLSTRLDLSGAIVVLVDDLKENGESYKFHICLEPFEGEYDGKWTQSSTICRALEQIFGKTIDRGD